ncbi:5'/3'-nucleotidase SurE [Agromyces rhizosphaerae]|uniref:5'-nucleotidase n=1 Tax=Agromyces rhizosphaerae TaxID=88374 RepID=A0A9W6FSJ6_9MICO|nr:5'/3'-nucleotidase SurE [Agromyces rhizosphaerae]GLI28218.1 5'/3'-nucleotidase SurE [Agromyces rhizosphaerae]
MTTALVTNDDGIASPGLLALARRAQATGLDVIVAAPAGDASGTSAAITAALMPGAAQSGAVRVERVALDGLDAPAYAVHAAPALIALIAAHGAFDRRPDVVLSGVNRGANVGHAILHSGTVGAALTGGASGARAIASSLDVGLRPTEYAWDEAAGATVALVPALLAEAPGTVLNLNVANRPGERPTVRAATLAPFGIVHTTMTERGEHEVELTVAELPTSPDPGSDVALLAEGYSTLTGVTAVGDSGVAARLLG